MIKKEQKGITLIGLIVTIIVILLIAGISISMLTGENGLIMQVQNAQEKTGSGRIQEEINLWLSEQNKVRFQELSSYNELVSTAKRLDNSGVRKESQEKCNELIVQEYFSKVDPDPITEICDRLYDEKVINQEEKEYIIAYVEYVNESMKYMEEAYAGTKIKFLTDLVSQDIISESEKELLMYNENIKIGDTEVGFGTDKASFIVEAGDYVIYDNEIWIVLHKNIDGSVEIIPRTPNEIIKLDNNYALDWNGNPSKSEARASEPDDYLTCVYQMNQLAQKYIINQYAVSARAMGTNPYNPREFDAVREKDLGYNNTSTNNFEGLIDLYAYEQLSEGVKVEGYLLATRDIIHNGNHPDASVTTYAIAAQGNIEKSGKTIEGTIVPVVKLKPEVGVEADTKNNNLPGSLQNPWELKI